MSSPGGVQLFILFLNRCWMSITMMVIAAGCCYGLLKNATILHRCEFFFSLIYSSLFFNILYFFALLPCYCNEVETLDGFLENRAFEILF